MIDDYNYKLFIEYIGSYRPEDEDKDKPILGLRWVLVSHKHQRDPGDVYGVRRVHYGTNISTNTITNDKDVLVQELSDQVKKYMKSKFSEDFDLKEKIEASKVFNRKWDTMQSMSVTSLMANPSVELEL